jgi:hypothetical protein
VSLARLSRAATAAALAGALLADCGGVAATGGSKLTSALGSSGLGGSQGCSRRVRLTVKTRLEIGHGVGPVAADGSTVWAARPQAGDIIRVTAAGRTVVHLEGTPISLAIGFGRLWVAERDADRVVSIDTRTVVQSTSAGVPLPVSVVTGSLGVWALSLDAGSLYQFDPIRGAGSRPFDSPVAHPSDMVMVGDELWVLGAAEHGLSPFNAKLGRIVRSGLSRPGQPLSGLSAAGGTIWLGEPASRSLLRVEADTVSARQLPAPNGIRPTATAVGACGLWVADETGDLALVDSQTAAPLGPPIHLGRSVAALAPSGTGVWATDPLDGALVRVGIRSTS